MQALNFDIDPWDETLEGLDKVRQLSQIPERYLQDNYGMSYSNFKGRDRVEKIVRFLRLQIKEAEEEEQELKFNLEKVKAIKGKNVLEYALIDPISYQKIEVRFTYSSKVTIAAIICLRGLSLAFFSPSLIRQVIISAHLWTDVKFTSQCYDKSTSKGAKRLTKISVKGHDRHPEHIFANSYMNKFMNKCYYQRHGSAELLQFSAFNLDHYKSTLTEQELNDMSIINGNPFIDLNVSRSISHYIIDGIKTIYYCQQGTLGNRSPTRVQVESHQGKFEYHRPVLVIFTTQAEFTELQKRDDKFSYYFVFKKIQFIITKRIIEAGKHSNPKRCELHLQTTLYIRSTSEGDQYA